MSSLYFFRFHQNSLSYFFRTHICRAVSHYFVNLNLQKLFPPYQQFDFYHLNTLHKLFENYHLSKYLFENLLGNHITWQIQL